MSNRILITAFAAAALAGCSPQQSGKGFPSEAALEQLVHPGMRYSELVKAVGKPSFEDAQNELKVLTYIAPVSNVPPRRDGWAGFEVVLRDEKVLKWMPILAGVPGGSAQPPSPSAETSVVAREEKIPLKVFVVSDGQVADGRQIEIPLAGQIGQISKMPQMIITNLVSLEPLGEPSNPGFVIQLQASDAKALEKLTSENVGKHLALVFGSRIVAAPLVTQPLSTGKIILSSLPKDAYRDLSDNLAPLVSKTDENPKKAPVQR